MINIYFFVRQSFEINWKRGEGELEKIQLANDCDFVFDDLYNKSASSGDECAKFCRDDKRCTHFTYSTKVMRDGKFFKVQYINLLGKPVLSYRYKPVHFQHVLKGQKSTVNSRKSRIPV